MRTILVLFVVFCTHSMGLCVVCPKGFLDLEGRCYYYSDEPATWLESASKCADMESSLLSIETEEEAILTFHQAVKENAGKLKAVNYWTSGLLAKVSGPIKPQFVWASTWEPFSYTAWCNGEPNNWENDEYCVHLTNVEFPHKRACWNDRGCLHSTTHSKHPMHFICETEGQDEVTVPQDDDNKITYEISIHEI